MELTLDDFIKDIEGKIRGHDVFFPSIAIHKSLSEADRRDFTAKDMERSGIGGDRTNLDIAHNRIMAGITYEDFGYAKNAGYSYERASKAANRIKWYDVSLPLLERAVLFLAGRVEGSEMMWTHSKLAMTYAMTGNFEMAEENLRKCERLAYNLGGIPDDMRPYHLADSMLKASGRTIILR